MIRVVVQERRRLLRSGMRALLSAEPDLELVGTAVTDLDVRRLVRAFAVDVAVFELVSEGWDVAALATAVRTDCPEIRLVGLHPGRRSDHAARSAAVGVDEMLSYGTGVAGLVAAIHGDEGDSRAPAVDRRVLPGREILTAREREVLLHISAGYTTQQSAQLLSLSPKTVDNHKQRMFAKLDVQNQAHAVAVAHRAGIIGSAQDRNNGD